MAPARPSDSLFRHAARRSHRASLRAQGLRPIEIWVPDVRSPAFRAEAHRQSLAVAGSPRAREDQGFIVAVSALMDDAGDDERLPKQQN